MSLVRTPYPASPVYGTTGSASSTSSSSHRSPLQPNKNPSVNTPSTIRSTSSAASSAPRIEPHSAHAALRNSYHSPSPNYSHLSAGGGHYSCGPLHIAIEDQVLATPTYDASAHTVSPQIAYAHPLLEDIYFGASSGPDRGLLLHMPGSAYGGEPSPPEDWPHPHISPYDSLEPVLTTNLHPYSPGRVPSVPPLTTDCVPPSSIFSPSIPNSTTTLHPITPLTNSAKRQHYNSPSPPHSSPHTPGRYNSPPHKRRKSTSAALAKEGKPLTEDDRLLLKLKDEEALQWKKIAERFEEEGMGAHKVPTLQMRYKRLKERLRVWEKEDISYLQEAHRRVEADKWERVSATMLELGCKKKIPAKVCESKYSQLMNDGHVGGSGSLLDDESGSIWPSFTNPGDDEAGTEELVPNDENAED